MEAEVTCAQSVNSVWSACSEPSAAQRGACRSPKASMRPHSQRAAGQAGAANRPRLGQAGGSERAAGQGPMRDGDTARGGRKASRGGGPRVGELREGEADERVSETPGFDGGGSP